MTEVEKMRSSQLADMSARVDDGGRTAIYQGCEGVRLSQRERAVLGEDDNNLK